MTKYRLMRNIYTEKYRIEKWSKKICKWIPYIENTNLVIKDEYNKKEDAVTDLLMLRTRELGNDPNSWEEIEI